MSDPRHRRLVVLRSDAQVEDALEIVGPGSLAWVSSAKGASSAPAEATSILTRELGRWLGRAFDLVVFDARAGLDADALGQVHGMVRGGGALLVVLRPREQAPAAAWLERLAAHPFTARDVGRRFATHVEATLVSRSEAPAPITSSSQSTRGTGEQAALVATLVQRWTESAALGPRGPLASDSGGHGEAATIDTRRGFSREGAATRVVIVADRGRGKSSALGLALAELAGLGTGGEADLVVTAGSDLAVAEVLRFAGEAACFVPALELLGRSQTPAVIVVDEAAQLPVPLLQRLVETHGAAHFVFATTTHGYEGTGRGFALRFVTWLERRGEVERLGLREPIRWAAGDPVERAVFEALLLDAEPARLGDAVDHDRELDSIRFEALDRDALVADLPALRELFGLLVHAHYRTTPGDLERLLDAPNLQLHVARLAGRDGRDGPIVAATVVADEGALAPELCEAAHAGRTRLRAHALADALVVHLGRREAGALRMRRSVRIAVHPGLRRRGLATGLVDHVHRSAEVDLFGTLFGATPELVKFRRSLGYTLVRVSASRGARSGEPAVVMVRPVSAAGRELVARLRAELARELEVQLRLLAADDGLGLDAELIACLREGLDEPRPYCADERLAAARAYAHGPRTFESLAAALRGYLGAVDLGRLPPPLRAVVEGRALGLRGWRAVTREAQMASVPATMRALRRAVRLLVDGP